MWKWLGRNEQQIKAIFTIFAACFVAWEYHDQLYEGTIDRAISYVEKYDHGDVLEARSALDEFWMSEEVEKWQASLMAVKAQSGEETLKKYNKELPELLERQGMTPHILHLLNFYKTVSICGENEHCHPKTVCDYLFNDIQNYRENYQVLLSNWENELGDYSPGQIDRFIQKQCPQQMDKHCDRNPGSSYCRNNSSPVHPRVASRS